MPETQSELNYHNKSEFSQMKHTELDIIDVSSILWPHLSKCEWCWWVLTLGAQAGAEQWLLWPHKLPHRPPQEPIVVIFIEF